MDTVIDMFLWVGTLNPWGKTFWVCVIIFVPGSVFLFAASLLCGGYAGDQMDDEEEDTK